MKFLKSFGFFAVLSAAALFISGANADPVQGYYDQSAQYAGPQSQRAGAQSPRTTRTTAPVDAAAAKAGATTPSRAGQNAGGQAAGRSVAARSNAAATPRNVAARANANQSRTVRARVGMVGAASPAPRVSASASNLRGSGTVAYSSLYNRMNMATYTNIIDPNTGLISADAYSNCLESYYACMDEICTARNPGQRRCACAGRVKTFANVEAQLRSATEDLLKVSGELSLLIATKGKDISAAFRLTDAEKVLNCVSWRDLVRTNPTDSAMTEWCQLHMMYDSAICSKTVAPAYCNNTTFGLTGAGMEWMNNLDGADSDILASLQQYANTIQEINVITTDDVSNLFNSFTTVNEIVTSLNGTDNIFMTSETSPDTLAQTWGYDLFQYAHNNVCNRVLDSCFNGIFEACGSYTNISKECRATMSTAGPFNYNSCISVNNDGKDLNFIIPSGATQNASPACYGYTTTSGDPYSSLRGPVADARRSVLQKYALDANADCDLYGEELRKQAQNMNYQKIAATQLLQKKRLEFRMDEDTAIATALASAKTTFKRCVDEIYDCYDQQSRSNTSWTAARIRNYCAQSAEVPSCYSGQMLCDQDALAIFDAPDIAVCYVQYTTGSVCRNIVTMNEILNRMSNYPMNPPAPLQGPSRDYREWCMQHTPGIDGDGSIRMFGVSAIGGWGPGSCPGTAVWDGARGSCVCSVGNWNPTTHSCI